MKTILGTFLTAALFAGMTFVASAQDAKSANQDKGKAGGSYESKSTDTTTTDTGTTKTMTDTVYGKVEEYEPGKSIKISTPGKTEGAKTYDLTASDVKAHVASNIKVGDMVSVKEKTDNNGKKMLTISRAKHAAREQSGTSQPEQKPQP